MNCKVIITAYYSTRQWFVQKRETINVMQRIADYLGVTDYTYTPPTIGAQSSKVHHDYIRRYKTELRTGNNVY